MSRMDWKRGRWSAEVETQKIGDALRGYQPAFGDQMLYYRFDFQNSQESNIYDEATGTGRVYKGSIEVPVLHVVHTMGGDDLEEAGFYTNDQIQITVAFRQFSRTGMTHADLRNGSYLRDRLAYDDKLFRVLGMAIQGQIVRSDLVVSIDAVQVKSDEVVDDVQFAEYAVDKMAIQRSSLPGYGRGEYGSGMYGE